MFYIIEIYFTEKNGNIFQVCEQISFLHVATRQQRFILVRKSQSLHVAISKVFPAGSVWL